MGDLPSLKRPLLGVAVALCFGAPAALANPGGEKVVSGSASFARSGSTLTVTNTPGAIINWQQFSIQQNEVTRFIQQSAASAVLNRVVGGNPSAILGTLSSNGRVFLVNPSGITIGRGAMIDVAGFAASTLNLSDADFLSGRNLFQGIGSEGKLVNAGTIKAAEGGHVYLVAPGVENQKDAVITSPKGEVVIAAGKTVELVNSREPDVRVEFTAPQGEAVNAGAIVAASGRIGIYGTLVRNSGLVSASRAVVGEGGRIVFRAAQDTLLEAGSKIEATGDKGGTVQVLGGRVGVLDGASIDASGDAGGGTVLVGGDFQGKNAQVPNAWRTFFGAEASIRADARAGGDGGKVIVWSDDLTRAYGTVSARGGAQGGNGGFAEISGKNLLDFLARVDVGAPRGAAGTLLLDPLDIVVSNATTTDNAQLGASMPASGDPAGAVYFGDGAGANFTISDEALEAQSANIVLQASRDITLNNNLSGGLALATPGQGITLQAGRHITIGSAITTQGGAIHLEADSPHAPVTGSGDGRNPADGVGQLAFTSNGGLGSNGGHITLIAGGNPINNQSGPDGGIALSENRLIDAGAGGINVGLSGNAPLGVGSIGLVTQILGNPMDELHTTGALVIGSATTAGPAGNGVGGVALLADSISNIYPASAMDLSPASGSSFSLVAGSGGIVLDQPLTTYQPTIISTTGTLTINDPINTTSNDLTLVAANVTTGANGSINTGSGACSGPGCPVSSVFWDGGGDGTNWFDRFNWSGDQLPTAGDDVTIGSGFGTIQVGASGAAAKSLIANSGVQVFGAGTLDLASASQFSSVFTLAGGSLLGTGSASVTGPGGVFGWSGGTMGAGGTFQLVSGRSGTLTNSLVLNRTFQNEGLLTLAGATLSGSGAFANAGTITAAAGTTNAIANAFQNVSGTIAGMLQVNGALTMPAFSANDGAINIASAGSFSTGNASLGNLATGVIVADGAFSVGSGTFDNSGSATFNGTPAMGALVQSGGTTTINGALSVATLNLAGGTVNGTGDLSVATNFIAGGGTLGTTFSDLALTRSGDFAVGGFTAVDSITLRATGAVTLAGAVTTTTGGGDSIVIAGTSFANNAGASALNPGAGRFLVWSGDPAADNRGGLAYDFKQYGASHGVSTVLGTGNGFLYTVAPSVTPILAGTVSKTYDATTAATLAPANFSALGAIDGDTVTLDTPAAGVYANKDAGTGKSVSASGIALAGASNGAATVYGYQLASASASGNIGEITPATLTYLADAASRIQGEPNPHFSGAVTGFVNGESLATATSGSLLWTSPADAASAAGSYAIDGGGLAALNGNYLFVQAASNASALTITASLAIPPALINPPPPPPPPQASTQGANVPLANATLLNLNTGQTVQAPENALPDPGIYLSQGGGSVMVVGQGTAATQLVFPASSYEPGTYVNSENGLIYVVEDRTPLDPGVYYNRDERTVLVVSSNSDGNITVASADVKETVQAVAGGSGRRVASVVCR